MCLNKNMQYYFFLLLVGIIGLDIVCADETVKVGNFECNVFNGLNATVTGTSSTTLKNEAGVG